MGGASYAEHAIWDGCRMLSRRSVLGNGFYVAIDGSHGPCGLSPVITGSGKRFIETVRDSSRPDNLLSLPEC